jgi:exodeoxyribonuclease V gamma subunit
MLHVYQSNRLEWLSAELRRVLAVPLPSPFAAERVVVQGVGMARWLSLYLANALGVCANMSFPLPSRFIWESFATVLPGVPETSEFEPNVLLWRVLKVLRHLDDSPTWTPLKAYLKAQDERSAFELAAQITDAFDQYLIYRPDWIRDWEAGEETHWQAELWRTLVQSSSGQHWVHIQDRFLAALNQDQIDWRRLPERVSVFGVTSLSPAYLEILARMASGIDIHLFLLNPCREYWGDIVSEKGRKGARLTGASIGHPLLASWGKPGRDFMDMVIGYEGIEHEGFVEPDTSTLPGRLQADILDLIPRGTEECPAAEVTDRDLSLQLHSCHSPMRELEVLHDQLLRLFEELPGLRPSDILVMTPDIGGYAPYVEAVFGVAEGRLRIPYGIEDQGVSHRSPLLETFFHLFQLQEGRLEAEEVMAFVASPAVLRRFELEETHVPALRQWVREAGIRWAMDGGHKARLGVPADDAHTWRNGLGRMLLGYAMPAEDRLFSGILPCETAEGGDALNLGRFMSLCETLFGVLDELGVRHTISQWVEVLNRALDRLFDPPAEEEPDLARIRETLNNWRQTAQIAGFDESISLDVVRAHLEGALDPTAAGGHFPSGGVTFSALAPMGGVPFRVVCLIGMDDGAFPRMTRKLGFDLMANDFRRGDRSRREDDRYIFLQAILSARDCLYLSYVGQDIRDNSERPPSVLVNELLDHLDRGFVGENGRSVREKIVVRHPLQAFSRRYFTGEERLFSYSQTLCEATRMAGVGEERVKPLLTQALPEAGPERRMLSIDDLIRFLGHPVRYLLQERLGLYLDEGEEELPGHEPFALQGLEGWALRQRLLDLRLEGKGGRETLPLFRAGGLLPHGQVGEVCFERQIDTVESFAARLGGQRPAEFLEPVDIDLMLGDMRLTGRLSGLTPDGLLGYRLSKVSARDILTLWLRHLTLNAAALTGVRHRSCWIGEDKSVSFGPVEGATDLLRDLLAFYWQGLHRPLPLFPKSSLAYARAAGKGHDNPLVAAWREWLGNEYAPGECQDLYYDACYCGLDPLDGEFTQVAIAVFGPLLSAIREE